MKQAIAARAGPAQTSHRSLSKRGCRREFRLFGPPVAAKSAAESAVAARRATTGRSPVPGAPACGKRGGRGGDRKHVAAVHDQRRGGKLNGRWSQSHRTLLECRQRSYTTQLREE